MGNAVIIVMSYRLNKDYQNKSKEKIKKKNLSKYLYGKYFFKDVSCFSDTNPLLRKKKNTKNL